MRDFKTDQVQSSEQPNEKRTSQVEQIKKVVPDFNDEGKSGDYIQAFYEAITNVKGEKKTEEVSKNNDNDTATGIKDAQDNYQNVADMKNQRLNMKGAAVNE